MSESEVAELGEVEEQKDGDGGLEPSISGPQQSDIEQRKALLQERRLALAKDPRNVHMLNEVGELAEAAGDLERAHWAYKRAIRLDPSYADPYRNLGQLYEKEGRNKQAVLVLQNYLRYAGDEADIEPAMQSLKSLLGDDDKDTSELCADSPACKQLTRKWDELGLTPGEALYLLDPENSDGQEMMRYTLLDMIMKGVLEVDERYGVGRGEKFGASELKPHEVVFAKYFARYRDMIDLDRLAQTVALELDSRFDLYKNNYVRRVLVEKGYIQKETQRVGGVFPVQRYVLSDKGIRASNQLRRLLKEVGVQMDGAAKTNPQQANAYVAEGGPAILLMESYPAGYFQEWLKTLDRIGLGPAIQKTKSRLLNASTSELVDEIVKSILGN
jgi:tetratricopeptide (TPR) repeat protein